MGYHHYILYIMQYVLYLFHAKIIDLMWWNDSRASYKTEFKMDYRSQKRKEAHHKYIKFRTPPPQPDLREILLRNDTKACCMRQKRGALETPVSTRLNTLFWTNCAQAEVFESHMLNGGTESRMYNGLLKFTLIKKTSIFQKGRQPSSGHFMEAACRWKEACEKMYTTARRMKTTVTEKLHAVLMANIVGVRRKKHAMLLPVPSAVAGGPTSSSQPPS